jgi:ankyrin repeat protein
MLLLSGLALNANPARADPTLDRELREALGADQLDASLALIRRGAAVDTRTASGRTALMLAAGRGEVAAVAELLRRGADIQAVNRNGGTALMYAAVHPAPGSARLLLAWGARPNHVSANGWSALTVAAAKGRVAIVRALLAANADAGVRDLYGWTPLMRAIDNGHSDTVATLLEAPGAAVNATNDAGLNALHIAAANGAVATTRLLLEHGADPRQRDDSGRLPSDLARHYGHTEILGLLPW